MLYNSNVYRNILFNKHTNTKISPQLSQSINKSAVLSFTPLKAVQNLDDDVTEYVSVIAFLYFPTFQSYFIFMHWLNFPNGKELDKPECFGLQGGWHILSRISSKNLSSNLRACDIDCNIESDPLFEEGIKKADLVIIYFHGQIGNRGKENRVNTYKALRVAIPTADIITIDYRGFADSDGFPSEDGVLIDARATWDWVVERFPENKILIYGHSLGSGVAIRLARQLHEEGIRPLSLILESPFTSIPDLVTSFRRIPFMKPFVSFPEFIEYFKNSVVHKFDNLEHVKHINGLPVFIIHAHKDLDIPLSNSRELFNQIVASRQRQNNHIEHTFTNFAREGILYMQTDLKTWYLQPFYAAHNNAHGWEFVSEQVKDFLELNSMSASSSNNGGNGDHEKRDAWELID
ncbi:12899_t:CDS:10 [Entrophospora sp. SA101]|nr:12899_t:CDS:10 [Entrophospora sp. SA101]